MKISGALGALLQGQENGLPGRVALLECRPAER
jgi:hypothetical protein